MKSRLLWHESKDKSILREIVVTPRDELVMVKSMYSFISQGTERLVSGGMVPVDLHTNMRVPYMQGDLSLPCSYGYSLVGEVVSENHSHFRKLVHIMHPHQEVCLVGEGDLNMIPGNISPKVATLHSNMETAVTGVWNSAVENGQKILISGFGSIGALTAIALKQMTHTNIFISDKDEDRLNIAQEMGFEIWRGESVHRAFHSTSTESGLQACIDTLEDFGRIIELSWYGDRKISLDLGGSFHYGNKQIISSQVSQIPPHMKGWDFNKRSELMWQLLEDDACSTLVENEIGFSESPGYFNKLRSGMAMPQSTVIRYN